MMDIICLYEDGELFHEGSLDSFVQENDGFSPQERCPRCDVFKNKSLVLLCFYWARLRSCRKN
jgi:hypothetical protein